MRELFREESIRVTRLNHPNIVPIYDAGECPAGPYLVFEYVEGRTLAHVLKEHGPYSVEEAVPLFSAILKGLAAAHAAEILHLDLSPRNILIDQDNTPRIMDFGLSRFASVPTADTDVELGAPHTEQGLLGMLFWATNSYALTTAEHG